jgi:hypothetical protein
VARGLMLLTERNNAVVVSVALFVAGCGVALSWGGLPMKGAAAIGAAVLAGLALSDDVGGWSALILWLLGVAANIGCIVYSVR